MRSRAVRLTLLLLAVGALGTAAYLTWKIERRTAAAAAMMDDAGWKLDDAARQVIEIRSAQRAYVAAGQSEQFWIARVTESVGQLQETFTAVRAAQPSADTVAALDRASKALADFSRLDRRARDYASSGQKLLASDLIFSDGFDATQQILAALDEARSANAGGSSAAAAAARRELAAVAGGGAAVALLALVLLTSPGRMPEPEPVVTIAPVATPKPAPRAAVESARTAKPVAPPPPAPATPPPALQDVADVCTQLARAADTSSLPALLQRTALALDAAGVVLWIVDPDGTELVRVASHGYAPAALSHMGPIARDAENVTAAAFRTGLVQTVKGDTLSNGAIAAPLVNTSGCVGVLSAEVRNDGERQPARLALASIVAAQLATLTAPATRTENRAAL